MADPISVAASIAGLIGLAQVVIEGTYKAIVCCRNAGKDARRLLSEVQSLLGILQGLYLLSTRVSSLTLQKKILADDVYQCQTTLESIRNKLEKADPGSAGSTLRRMSRIFIWPITFSETEKILADIERHKSTFDLSLSIDALENLLVVSATQQFMIDELDHIKQSLCRIEMTAERKEMLEFFGTFDSESSHETSLRLYQSGTGLWLVQGSAFEAWLAKRNGKLWLYGIPGAGKTVLAALVIEKAVKLASDRVGVASYYCDHKNTKTLEPAAILSSLAGQLARQNERCFALLQKCYKPSSDNIGRHNLPRESELIKLISRMAPYFEDVMLIVDAVDECYRQNQITALLSDLAARELSNIKILLLSRDVPDVRRHVDSFVQLSIAAQSSDLRLYVAAQIEERTKEGRLRLRTADFKAEIMERLVEGAEGMFRWVACQIDHLCELPSDAARRRALHSLPPDLHTTYERILDRVHRQNEGVRTLVQRTLYWLMQDQPQQVDQAKVSYWDLTRRLPNIEEIIEAVAIDPEDDTITPDSKSDIEDVLMHCSSLVRLSTDSRRIEFAHFTVEEYLKRPVDPETPSHLIRYHYQNKVVNLYKMSTCLTYLNMTQFEEGILHNASDWLRRRQMYPFLQFASGRWYEFASEVDFGPAELSLIHQLFGTTQSGNFKAWAQAFSIESSRYPLDHAKLQKEPDKATQMFLLLTSFAEASALHFASVLGLPNLIDWLLKQGADVDTDSNMGRPLHCAMLGICAIPFFGYVVRAGNTNFLSSILDGSVRTRKRSLKAMNTLLEAGANAKSDINFARGESRSSLWLAILTGSMDQLPVECSDLDLQTVEYLLKDTETINMNVLPRCIDAVRLDDLDDEGRSLWLRFAMRTSSAPIQPTTLSVGTAKDPKTIAEQKQNLLLACYRDFVGVVRHLHEVEELDLNEWTDPEFGDSYLTVAARRRSTEVLEYLIENNADLKHRTNAGESALHLLFRERNPDVKSLSLLLSKGLDANEPTLAGSTPLHCCARTGDVAHLEVLLQSGADPRCQTSEAETIWHVIAECNNIAHYRYFKANMADEEFRTAILTADKKGQLPIHFAAANGAIDIFTSILEDSSFLLPRGRLDRSLLHYAAEGAFASLKPLEKLCSFESELVQLVLPDEVGDTPLHSLVLNFVALREQELLPNDSRDFKQATKLLCGAGCDINARANDDTATLDILFDQFPKETRNLEHRERYVALIAALQTLLAHGADPLQRSSRDYAPLDGLLVGLQNLLGGNESVFTGDEKRATAIFLPILDTRPHNEALDYRFRDKSLLSWAAVLRLDGLAFELLEMGAIVDKREKRGRSTPIEHLCDRGCTTSVIELAFSRCKDLILNEGKDSLLHFACGGVCGRVEDPRKLEVLKFLVTHGVDVDSLTVEERTPLIYAARNARTKAMKILVEHGADISRKDRDGNTALNHASMVGELEAVRLLIDAGSPFSVGSTLVRVGAAQLRATLGPIEQACINGSKELVEMLLPKQESYLDVPEVTSLWIASCAGRTAIVRFLISSGFSVEAEDEKTGWRPIHVASRYGYADVVQILLEAGCDIQAKDKRNRSAAVIAATQQHKEAMSVFLNHYQKPVQKEASEAAQPSAETEDSSARKQSADVLSHSNYDALMAMIDAKDLSTISIYRASGGEIDIKLPCGSCTPLTTAIRCNYVTVSEYLLNNGVSAFGTVCKKHGVDLSVTGWSNLHLAAENPSHSEVLLRILQKEDMNALLTQNQLDEYEGLVTSLHPVHVAARFVNHKAVRILLDHGADPNLKSEPELQTPLHEAAASLETIGEDRLKTVLLLLESGANPNAQNYFLETPLLRASNGGEVDILDLLITHGADVNLCDDQGRSALHNAASSRVLPSVNLLRKHGLSMYHRNSLGWTPLCELLAGAPGVKRSDERNSAYTFVLNSDFSIESSGLLCGFEEWEASIFRMLIKRYPRRALYRDSNTRHTFTNYASSTPLYDVASRGSLTILQMLHEIGALVNLEGGSEGTPLIAASSCGRLEAVKYLVRRGALLLYEKKGRTISALKAARYHPEIIQWLLVGRYLDQKTLPQCTSESWDEAGLEVNAGVNLDLVFEEDWDNYLHTVLNPPLRTRFICRMETLGGVIEEIKI